MPSKKILVAGGAGYIGSHVVLELIKSGFTPVIVDNFSNSQPAVIPRLEMLAEQSISWVRGDCRDNSLMDSIFKRYHFDAVMYFAGLKSVSESISAPLEYYDHNVSGLVNTLKSAQNHKVNNIIFSSSATVYATCASAHIPETARLGPINPYGQSKLMCEQIIEDLCNSNANVRAAIMRYFNPIGTHPSGLIGESPNQTPNNLMPFINRVAGGQSPELIIYGNDYDTLDGTGVRDYIHVIDLARGHVQALNFIYSNNGVHHFNLGTGKGTSVLDLVNMYEKANARSVPYRIGARRSGDQSIVVADPTKARDKIGFECQYTTEDACRHSWNWQTNNPTGYIQPHTQKK